MKNLELMGSIWDLALLKPTQLCSGVRCLPCLVALYSEAGDLSKSRYKNCLPCSSGHHSLTQALSSNTKHAADIPTEQTVSEGVGGRKAGEAGEILTVLEEGGGE